MNADTPKPVKKDIWYMWVAATGTVRPAVSSARRIAVHSQLEAGRLGGEDILAPANPTTLIRIPAM